MNSLVNILLASVFLILGLLLIYRIMKGLVVYIASAKVKSVAKSE